MDSITVTTSCSLHPEAPLEKIQQEMTELQAEFGDIVDSAYDHVFDKKVPVRSLCEPFNQPPNRTHESAQGIPRKDYARI